MTMLPSTLIVALRNVMQTVMYAMLATCSRNVAYVMRAMYGVPLRHRRRAVLSEVLTPRDLLG